MMRFNLDPWRETRKQEREAIKRVIDRGQFILGPELEAFEFEFAIYLGIDHVIGVGSGSAALKIIHRGLRPGASLHPSHNAAYAAMASHHAGIRPRWCEVDDASWLLDPQDAGERLDGLSCIVPVHLYGRIAWSDSLEQACRRNGIKIIEDACQAHGATWFGRKAGTLGWAAAFSFYPTKNLGCLGEGGAIATWDASLDLFARRLRDGGRSGRYQHAELGYSSCLDEIQATVLRIRLKKLDEHNRRRREAARRYCFLFGKVCPEDGRVWHLFVIRVPKEKRQRVIEVLNAAEIPAFVHYPIPLHRQPCFPASHSFPVSEGVADSVVSLPFFPGIEEKNQDRVAALVKSVVDPDEITIQA